MFPVIPAIVIGGSSISLGWYYKLSPKERSQADRETVNFAKKIFGKILEQLTTEELKIVLEFVKKKVRNN